ncbi:hypothetical protein HELRODRAFT_151695, partial [Helobdella robusta]|uniref:PRELI/MSF1 domain-containing protein n=1 Tax=Helobdella robusta TaxID=6412 RepID=T1EKL9_HELRO
MVRQYNSPVWTYKHNFETVMKAYEKRFPVCDKIPSFCGSEVVRETDDGIEQCIVRRCYFAIDMPLILKKILNVDKMVFVQTNVLNRDLKTLNIDAVNESFSSKITVTEHCVYYIHPDNLNWTCFHQHATMDVKSLFGLENIAEKFVLKQYNNNIKKGKEILEFFIEEIKK